MATKIESTKRKSSKKPVIKPMIVGAGGVSRFHFESREHTAPVLLTSPGLRTFKASEILAAGGPDRFFAERGIDNRKTQFGGRLDLSKEETKQILRDLREGK